MATRSVDILINAKDKASPKFKRLGKSTVMLAKKFARVAKVGAAAFAAIGAGAIKASKDFADAGAMLLKTSQQTGVAVESLSRLKFASGALGIEFDDTTGLIEEFNIRMGETIQDGVGPMSDAFRKLGLDAKQLAEMPVPQAIGRIGDELNKLSASDRGFLADEIFGGDAFKLMPLLNQGSEGIAKLTQRADRLGVTMSGTTAEGAAKLARKFHDLQAVGTASFRKVGAAIAPFMENILSAGTTLVTNWNDVWATVGNATGLFYVRVWEETKHLFMVQIPSVLDWLLDNWKTIFRDIGVAMVTVVKNAATNIKDILVLIKDFITSGFEGGFGELFSDVGKVAGRNLLEGFKAQTKELPQIAARQKSELEKSLEEGLARSSARVAEGFRKNSDVVIAEAAGIGERMGSQLAQSASESASQSLFSLIGQGAKFLGGLIPEGSGSSTGPVTNTAQQGRLLSGRSFLSQDPQKQVAKNTQNILSETKATNTILEEVQETLASTQTTPAIVGK